MTKIHYKEQDTQIRCVKYFRVSYPHLAHLLFHPKNEEAGGRARAAIAKAEGVQAGVADLMLPIVSDCVQQTEDGEIRRYYYGLAIEMKTKKGRQSEQQKIFQRYFEAVGGKYVVIRTYEDFCKEIDEYVLGIPSIFIARAKQTWCDIDKERTAEAKRELEKLINKSK